MNNGIESIYAILCNATRQVVCAYDFKTKGWSYISDSVLKVSGYSAEEIINDRIEWIPEKQLREILGDFSDEKRGKNSWDSIDSELFEKYISINTREGKSVAAVIRVLFINSGNEITGFIGLIETVSFSNVPLLLRRYINTLQLSSHTGILLFDADGYLRNINDRALDMMKFKREELLGKHYLGFAEPRYHEEIQTYKDDLDRDFFGRSREIFVRKKDGFLFNARFLATTIRNESGDIEAYVVAAREIPDSSKIARQLRLTEENFKGLLEAIPEPAGILDTDLNIIVLNNAAIEKLETIQNDRKYSRDDFIGRCFTDFFVPETALIFWEKRKELMEGKEFQQYELKIGENYFQLHIYPIFDSRGEISRIAGYAIDVTRKMRTEKDLVNAEIRYRQVLDNMFEGFLITDKDLKIIYVNKKILQQTGLPSSFFLGQDLPFMVLGANRSEAERHIAEVIEKGESRFISDIEIPNKGRMTIMFSGSEIVNENNEFDGIQVLTADITVMKEARRQLQYKADFQKLIVDISTRFISLSNTDIDKGIEDAIERVGLFNNEENVFILQFIDNMKILRRTLYWVSENSSIVTGDFFEMDLDCYPSVKDVFLRGEVIKVTNLFEYSGISENEKNLAERHNLCSILCVPLRINDNFMGYLGFASSVQKEWSEDAISLLEMVAAIFINAFERKRIKHDLLKAVMNRLSDREGEFLRYLVEGMTWPADKRLIAKKMDVLPGTLDRFMSRIKEKVRSDEIDQFIDSIRLSGSMGNENL